VPCSLFWISWCMKMGSIGCPETSVRNYHCTVYSISEECRSYWWFDDGGIDLLCIVCLRMIPFRAVRFIASYVNFRQLHIFKCQILGINLVLHSSKYSIKPLCNTNHHSALWCILSKSELLKQICSSSLTDILCDLWCYFN